MYFFLCFKVFQQCKKKKLYLQYFQYFRNNLIILNSKIEIGGSEETFNKYYYTFGIFVEKK